jgi:hypothetical protein
MYLSVSSSSQAKEINLDQVIISKGRDSNYPHVSTQASETRGLL